MSRRYDVTDFVEAQFEPGSRGRVLKNLLGIRKKREMDLVEAREQFRALVELVETYGEDHRFTSEDVCAIHRLWLGPVYEWAGRYRKVNLTKDDFPFSAAHLIQASMDAFEKDQLARYTPCKFADWNAVVEAIAVVHAELLLIHPFREGNGRVARMLATLMALQAGLPPLNFTAIRGRRRQEYFAAVRAALDRDYRPMEIILGGVVRRTLRKRILP